ncbi:hypothetical protein FHG87_004735 [Trinorchestia longiramus]|nr:hypothetical protein FHG87_004735 [Trinorchestia longiramus]
MKLENGQNLQDHLKVFVELFEELAIIGDATVEEERVIILLSPLPDRFSTLVLLSRDVVFNESQFMSFEKEPSKEIECVPCSFPQEEKHEDSEGESELRRSTRNRAAPDRFGEWVCFAQAKFDVPRAMKLRIGTKTYTKVLWVAFCTKEIDLACCPSNDMLADIFTKSLSAEKFSRPRRKLGVVFFEKHIQCEKEC